MEKIKIVIPDNLSKDQELLLIAKELSKKYLPGKNQKLIGSGYELKHLQTQIIIERQPTETAIVTKECFCGTIFELKYGFKLYSNYGGRRKKLLYCSDTCRQHVMDVSGEGRTALSINKLKSFIPK